MAGPLGFCSAEVLPDVTGDDDDRSELKENFCTFRPRPPTQTADWSESMAKEVTPNPTCRTRDNFWDPAVSSNRHNAPVSEPTTASLSEIVAIQVKVLSPNAPNKQFLPERAFGAGLGELAPGSAFRRDLGGDPGLCSGSLQTFTCRTPVLQNGYKLFRIIRTGIKLT